VSGTGSAVLLSTVCERWCGEREAVIDLREGGAAGGCGVEEKGSEETDDWERSYLDVGRSSAWAVCS
jgi:hypothetical protein